MLPVGRFTRKGNYHFLSNPSFSLNLNEIKKKKIMYDIPVVINQKGNENLEKFLSYNINNKIIINLPEEMNLDNEKKLELSSYITALLKQK